MTAVGAPLNHDLHVKMSKKIAQLTKVIYVLNTRNDDHETVLEDIVKRHKVELRQTVAEVSEKVEQLENRLKTQTYEQDKTTELQNMIKSQQSLLDHCKAEFLKYKEDVEVDNKRKDSEHLEQLSRLNDRIVSFGISYKDLLDTLEDVQRKSQIEQVEALKEMEEGYERSIREMKEEFGKKEKYLNDLISGSQKDVEMELRKTQEEVKEVTYSKEKTIMNYEDKIKELKETFQRDLSESVEETRKLLEFELEEAKTKVMDLEKKMIEKDDSLKSLTEKHCWEIKEKDVSLKESQKETESMRMEIKDKQRTVLDQANDIHSLKGLITKLEAELRTTRTDLENLKKMEDGMKGEVDLKTKQLKEMRINLESYHKKVLSKDNELQEAMYTIESLHQERKEMAHCPKSVAVDYEIEIQTLRRGLETLSKERIADKQTLERLQLNHEIELADLQNRLKNDHSGELERLTKKMDKEVTGKEKMLKEELQKMKEDHQTKLEEERSKASKMIEKLKTEMDQIKGESALKMKSKDKQISVCETSLAEKEKELKTLLSQLRTSKEATSTTRKECQKLTATVTEKDSIITRLTEDLGLMEKSLDQQMTENQRIQKTIKTKAQEDLSEKYNQLSADLDKKWADTLRRETGRVRNDMLDNFEKEKAKVIENVERVKNEEIVFLRNQMERNKSMFESELFQYKEALEKLKMEFVGENEELNKSSKEKIEQLQERILKEEKAHSSKIEQMNKENKREMEDMDERYKKERTQYTMEMERMLETTDRDWRKRHESMMTKMKEENEKMMDIRTDEMINDHNRQLRDHLHEMQMTMTISQEGATKVFEERIKDLLQKISLLDDEAKTQMINHRAEIDKLRNAKLSSDRNYEQLEQRIEAKSKENDYLKNQLEEFNEDFHRNQKELTEKLRKNEIDLKNHYEQILSTNKQKYDEDSKQTLADFTKAQNLFKDKIKELSVKLCETEERYENRPSRDEDVELIETLKAQLRSWEKEVERINEEKKFLQLELINRETNFNKIFNASPNIGKGGVDSGLNAIKTKKVSSDKMKAFPKLSPLPGSPFHDEPINHTRPLPPSRKSIDAS